MVDLLFSVAENDGLHDLRHVEAVGQRLADPLVLQSRDVRVVQAPSDVNVAVVLPLVELEVVGLRQVVVVARLDRAEGELAGLQLCRLDRRVGDDFLNEFVQVRRAAPVTVVTAQDHLVTLAPFLELERAADRGRCRVLGRGVDVLRRVIVDGVLAENVRRDRRDSKDIYQRGTE